MILLYSLIISSLISTGLWVYYIEYLGNGILFYTIPIVFILSFLALILLLVIFLAICLLFRPVDENKVAPTKFYSFFTTQVSLLVSVLFGVRIKIENLDLIQKGEKFLFISNHQAMFDPIAIIGYLRKYNISYIMKDGIMKIPFVGRWLHAAGFLPIDRKNDRNALKTIITASKRLKNGYPISVFPEGTRSGSSEVQQFKNGIFKIAEKAESAIVVAYVENFYNVKKRFPFKTTKCLLRICRLIPYEEIKGLSTNEVGDMCRDIIIENQKEARSKYSWIN